MAPQTFCSKCNKHLSSRYALARHNNEVHGKKERNHKCSLCSHKSHQSSDLRKHERAKHPGIAKPRGCKRAPRRNLLQTDYGQRLMAEAVEAALRKKRRVAIISSDEEEPSTSTSQRFPTPTATISTNPECEVTILPTTDTQMFTILPPSASSTTEVRGVGTVLHINFNETVAEKEESPICLS